MRSGGYGGQHGDGRACMTAGVVGCGAPIYVGQMPEAKQATLSGTLTQLLRATLEDWHGPLPRLAYITDKGSACDEYYHDVLKKMKHPRDGKLLAWEWVLDFWHVCSYIGKMADALFGAETKAGAQWFTKMRQWLKELPQGSGTGGTLGDATFGAPQDDQAAKDGVLEGIPLPTSAPPLDGLRGLPAAWLADRQRRDRGGVQNGIHAAFQAFGHALEPRSGPGDIGFARGVPERNLGRGIQNRLAFAGVAGAEQRCLGNRQPGESSGHKAGFRSSCCISDDARATTPDKTTILAEFLTFMKSQGLSAGQPLTIERMTAFLQASDFVESLLSLIHKLDTNFPLDAAIPHRFHDYKQIHDAYGRVAIRFATKDWKPFLSVGFMYDVRDHRVVFVNPDKGIDLLLRIEADPKHTKNIQPALDVLKEKRKELQKTAASVLFKGERGNGNNWSVAIIRDCLGDVIENATTEAEQLKAVHKRLVTWLGVLFNDRKLEDSLKRSGLGSGMK